MPLVPLWLPPVPGRALAPSTARAVCPLLSQHKLGRDTPSQTEVPPSFGNYRGSASGSSGQILPAQHKLLMFGCPPGQEGTEKEQRSSHSLFQDALLAPCSLASARGAIGVKYSGALAVHIL